MSQKTHAIAKKQLGSISVVFAITACGRSGYPVKTRPGGLRRLTDARGDDLILHEIGEPPTCKTCLKNAPMKDWSV